MSSSNETLGTNGIEHNDKDVSEKETLSALLPKPPIMLQIFGRFSFPWLLTLSVVQLAICLNKLYQDSAAVGKYFVDKDYKYCIVSTSCLFAPAVIYIIYSVSVYIKQKEDPEPSEVGTQVVHGFLLVPWQIKSRVEVLHFAAKRVCHIRSLTDTELEENLLLEQQAAVLEFFAKFYAGLTQLLLQLYIIIAALDNKKPYEALTDEIIASGLTLVSVIAAVCRRDDGILTGTLSTIGWTSIMISRAVAIAMAARVIYWWILLICFTHGFAVSLWITSIAIDTYGESTFNKKRKTSLFFLIFAVFGLPSLTYWPIMFELKEKKRPVIFLLLLLFENILFLFLWAWFGEGRLLYEHDIILLVVTATCFTVGSLFILFYICCKPKYTDSIVYHDMKVLNADSFGMYFEFCDVAFKLKRNVEVERMLNEIRTQKV